MVGLGTLLVEMEVEIRVFDSRPSCELCRYDVIVIDEPWAICGQGP